MKVSKSVLFLCVLLGLLLGIAGFTFYYARGASYLSNDPKACANCHVMQEQYDGWLRSSHHAVATCNDCHTPHGFIPKYMTKAENGYHHSKAFTLQDFHEPIMIHEKNAKILNRACLNCHADLVASVTEHAGLEQEVNACTRCHDGVGHATRK